MKNLAGQRSRTEILRSLGMVTVGTVGALALLGVPESADAANVRLGSDYVQTPAGNTSFNFGGPIDTVDFQGRPIPGLGLVDTIIERKQDVALVEGTAIPGMTPIEIVALSLESVAPVEVNGFDYDVFVTLDPNNPSTGNMTIRHENLDSDPIQGTWDSVFDLNALALFTPLNGGPSIPNETISKTFLALNEDWGHKPGPGDEIVNLNQGWMFQPPGGLPLISRAPGNQTANCHVDNNGPPCDAEDFFLKGLALHDAGDGKHGVQPPEPVPEPASTALASAISLGLGVLYRGRVSKKGKRNQEI